MASFTPLEITEDVGGVTADPAALRRQAHTASTAGARPTGIVIDKSCRVYVKNIPVERIEAEGARALRAEFESFGPLESYRLFTEKSGRFIGSALCTYRNPADAAMAITSMNGQTMDSTTLVVETAKDHGVLLLHQEQRTMRADGSGLPEKPRLHGFLPRRLAEPSGRGGATSGGDGRWHHDRFQLIAEGKDMDEVLGLRRRPVGGRGRGGRLTRGERVDAAFEKYIIERDALAAESVDASGAVAHAADAAPLEDAVHPPEPVEAPSVPAPAAPVAVAGEEQSAEGVDGVTAETVAVEVADDVPRPPEAL